MEGRGSLCCWILFRLLLSNFIRFTDLRFFRFQLLLSTLQGGDGADIKQLLEKQTTDIVKKQSEAVHNVIQKFVVEGRLQQLLDIKHSGRYQHHSYHTR